MKIKLPTAEKLAVAFVEVLRNWIGEGKLKEVVKRNHIHAINGNHAVCASHDFCDANQAMIDAFEKVTGLAEDQYSVTAEDVSNLMDAAWSLAKRSDFGLPLKTTAEVSVRPSEPVWEIKQKWFEEHGGEFAVPPLIQRLYDYGLLVDTSWHNDICPSFAINDGKDGQELQLWVDHPDASKREMPDWQRFRVCSGPGTEQAGDREMSGKDFYCGDSLEDALTTLFNAHLKGHLVVTAKASLAKAHQNTLLKLALQLIYEAKLLIPEDANPRTLAWHARVVSEIPAPQ